MFIKSVLMMPAGDSLQGGSAGLAEDLALLGGESTDETPLEPETPESDGEPIIPETEEKVEEPVEEPEEEEIEEKPPVADDKPLHDKPTLAQLQEKYPDILKQFPALKGIYYRERQYSELFPTMEDARVAVENDEAFKTFRESALSGDLTDVLDAVREADPKSLDKIASTILPTLNKLSPELHWKASLPVLQGLVQAVYQEGMRYGDTEQGNNLKNSAAHVAQFIFGNNFEDIVTGKRSLIPQPEKRAEESPEAKQLKEMQATRASEFYTQTEQAIFTGLEAKVMERGQHNKLKIDPDGVMTDFMRDTVRDRIMIEVKKALEADPGHMRYMRSLWTKAKDAGYVGDWKSRIQSAYLERAKSLVPAIRARLVAEALGTTAANNNNKSATLKKVAARKEPGGSGQVPNGAPAKLDPKSIDWRKTSDMDIMNGTATLRK